MSLDIQTNFYKNIQRVRELSQLHLALLSFPGFSNNSPLYSEDVLRSGIVFLHATLEDLIRAVIKLKLPQRGKEEIDKIPLCGISRNNQPTKFTLGNLVQYNHLTVQELIENSVKEYLNFTNYNRVEDIVEFLKDIGIDKTEFEHLFQSIGSLMERRHNIVHRADQLPEVDTLSSINFPTVEHWIAVIDEFGKKLIEKL